MAKKQTGESIEAELNAAPDKSRVIEPERLARLRLQEVVRSKYKIRLQSILEAMRGGLRGSGA